LPLPAHRQQISLAFLRAIARHGGMHSHDRFQLQYGPYRMPRWPVGRLLRCTIRGEQRVAGISAARIPWPQRRVGNPSMKGSGMLSLIVCGDLERAIRTESAQAVGYHWGVSSATVAAWRKALGVGPVTEGTSRLRRQALLDMLDDGGREKLLASLQSPERAAKIGAANRGRKQPREAVERRRQARLGHRHSDEARERMCQGQLARYARLARWTAEMDAELGTAPDRELGERFGLVTSSVRRRRSKLGVAAYGRWPANA
jgi:hypothetical protein